MGATTLLAGMVTAGPLGPGPDAWSATKTWYAYARGGAVAPQSCPQTNVVRHQCTLTEALAKVVAGGTVALATSSSGHHFYLGNWAVLTLGTSTAAPVTIEPAPGTLRPVFDGNHGDAKGCTTRSCNGPVLRVGPEVHLDLDGVGIQDADNTTTQVGGAIENVRGGTVDISRSTFTDNYAYVDGGAIDNADTSGRGTLVVSASTFTGNVAVNGDGGAIANADVGGQGTVFVSGSTFSGNNAINGDGGAIDNGDTRGVGHLRASSSTFVGNVAGRAGAIDNGDNAAGTLTVSGSSFSGNVAALDDAGAIDNADWGGRGSVEVSGSTFSANDTVGDGGAIDNADNDPGSRGTVTVTTSTFVRNVADVEGGAIDNADFGGTGVLEVLASTLSANSANDIYGAHNRQGGGQINSPGRGGRVWVAADIFNGRCYRSGGAWDDGGFNIGDNGTCFAAGKGDVSHGSDRLGPLGYHGGRTKTALLLQGNPAIAAIPYLTRVVLDGGRVTLCPATDQRGVRSAPRRHCAAGAVQPPA